MGNKLCFYVASKITTFDLSQVFLHCSECTEEKRNDKKNWTKQLEYDERETYEERDSLS